MVWLPFALHPEYPPEGISRGDLEARYGGRDLNTPRVAMFRENDLPAADVIEHFPNSSKALRLGELARERDRHGELHPRIFKAFWGEGADIGDDDVLTGLATEAGLEEGDVRDVLAGDRYGDFVAEATQKAMDIGAGGVPAWVLDGRMLIPGAQPHEVFERVLERFGHAPLDGDAAT